MPRFPNVAVVLAVVVAVGLTACDDGGSKDSSTPHRSTTTTPSTTTTTAPGGSTTTVPSGGTTTTTPEQAVGTCGNQTAAIVDAIQGSAVAGLDQRRGQYTVQQCRLAASAPIWAAAVLVPNPGVQLDQATVVLQRIGALWNVMDVGTSGTGCSDTPANIRGELRLVC